MKGVIVRIVRGQSCGFLRLPDAREVFFHRSDLTSGSFNDLAPSDAVTLELTEDAISGPRATNVRTVKAAKKAKGKSEA
jgi:cold shock CspA family protein